MVRLTVEGEFVDVAVERVVNLGYSGRDQDAVREHVEELLADDAIPAEPEEVPTAYQLATHALVVDPDRVQVVGPETSGEGEFGLLVTGRETYVVAASDQTDRALEKHGIQKAKQVAPNVVSAEAWRLSDVRGHWDDIRLRAHNTVDGERRRYQDAALAELLPPETVLDEVRERYGGPLGRTAVLSGTVPTVDGELSPGERFAVELQDPVRDRSIGTAYDVEAI